MCKNYRKKVVNNFGQDDGNLSHYMRTKAMKKNEDIKRESEQISVKLLFPICFNTIAIIICSMFTFCLY